LPLLQCGVKQPTYLKGKTQGGPKHVGNAKISPMTSSLAS